MKRLLAGLLIAVTCFAQQSTPAKDQKKDPPKKQVPQEKSRTEKLASFVQWLGQVAGVSAVSSVRGGSAGEQGDIWEQLMAGGPLQRLTSDGGYSWPVFSPDDRSVIAIRGEDLWSVPTGGAEAVKLAHTHPELVALAGSGPQGLVILTMDQVGTFSPESGSFIPFAPATQEDRDNMARLRSPGRSYHNDEIVVSERNGVISVASGGVRREIATEGVASLQPSVSHDLKRIVFIRSNGASR